MLGNHFIGLYEKAVPDDLSWAEKLDIVRRMGFDYVEISIDETDNRLERLWWSRTRRTELLSIVKDSGIAMRSLCLSAHRRFPFGSQDRRTREKAYEIMRRAVEFADFMGISIIQLAGYDVYYEPSTEKTREDFFHGLQWACAQASRHSVMLAMEIMDTPFLNSITKNLVLEQNLKSPWYRVYPDLGNLSAWGNDAAQELLKGIDSIVAVHLKDTLAVRDDFPGQFKGVPFGSGCVDFTSAFRLLEANSYCGPYLLEMWAERSHNYLDDIQSARSFIEEKFAAAVTAPTETI